MRTEGGTGAYGAGVADDVGVGYNADPIDRVRFVGVVVVRSIVVVVLANEETGFRAFTLLSPPPGFAVRPRDAEIRGGV